MTVAELIAKLQTLDSNATVKATMSEVLGGSADLQNGVRSTRYGEVISLDCDLDPDSHEQTAIVKIQVDPGVESKSWPAGRRA